jgi:DNA-binding XRE family transcriptional regulator
MKKRTNEIVLQGQSYLFFPREVIEKVAPQLLEQEGHTPFVPDSDGIPVHVVDNHIRNNISLIQAWREYLGLTQQEVAERMGVTQSSFQETEKARKPRDTTLEKVAKAMGLRLVHLKG